MVTHVKIWLALLLLAILTSPLLFSEKELVAAASKELVMVRNALGDSHAKSLVQSTNKLYSGLFVETGLVKSLKKRTSSETDRQDAGAVLGGAFYHFTTAANNYLLSMVTMSYMSLLRMGVLLVWIPFIGPFLVAAIVDGVVKHKIMHSSVRMSNPVKFAIAGHFTVLGIGAPLIYLFIPIATTPYFILIGAALLALSIMALISEMAPLSYQ